MGAPGVRVAPFSRTWQAARRRCLVRSRLSGPHWCAQVCALLRKQHEYSQYTTAAAALHTVHTCVRSLEPRGYSVFRTNLLSQQIGHTVLCVQRIEFLNPKLFTNYRVLSGRYYSAFWCSAIFRLIIEVTKSRIKLAVASASSVHYLKVATRAIALEASLICQVDYLVLRVSWNLACDSAV